MAIFWSDTVRNATVDAWETAIGASPKVRIYGGAVPANESAALGDAVLLAEGTLGADWAGAASGGVKGLTDTPITMTGLPAAGAGTTPTFYRIYDAAGAACHEQATVGVSAADMLIDVASIAEDQVVRITSWTKTAPH